MYTRFDRWRIVVFTPFQHGCHNFSYYLIFGGILAFLSFRIVVIWRLDKLCGSVVRRGALNVYSNRHCSMELPAITFYVRVSTDLLDPFTQSLHSPCHKKNLFQLGIWRPTSDWVRDCLPPPPGCTVKLLEMEDQESLLHRRRLPILRTFCRLLTLVSSVSLLGMFSRYRINMLLSKTR